MDNMTFRAELAREARKFCVFSQEMTFRANMARVAQKFGLFRPKNMKSRWTRTRHFSTFQLFSDSSYRYLGEKLKSGESGPPG